MILELGDMWSVFGKGEFMITTNPILRSDGAVVMGAGIALQIKSKYPILPYDFGALIQRYRNTGKEVPNVGYIGRYSGVPIYYFMVKDHWRAPAKLDIIQRSTECLKEFKSRVDLNFPGIGNGRLKRKDVLPLLETLPDNIHVWEYGNG